MFCTVLEGSAQIQTRGWGWGVREGGVVEGHAGNRHIPVPTPTGIRMMAPFVFSWRGGVGVGVGVQTLMCMHKPTHAHILT